MARTRPDVTFIDTPKKARHYVDQLHEQIKRGQVIATDTEFEPDTNEIVLMSYAWDRFGDRFVVEGSLVAEFYGEHLTNPKALWCYQNYGADADVFYDLGINPDVSFHADTMVMGWLHDENLMSHGLKEQAHHFLHWWRPSYDKLFQYVPAGKKRPVIMTPKQVMYDLPADALAVMSKERWRKRMIDYSGDDASSTFGLYEKHRRYLEKIGYWQTYLDIDRPFTLTLMRCEERGVLINRDRMQEILRLVNTRVMRAQHAFRAITGKPQFNLNSDPQMHKLLFEELHWPERDDMRTAKGYPQKGKEAMAWYKEEFLGRARRISRELSARKAPKTWKRKASSKQLLAKAAKYRRYHDIAMLRDNFKREATKRGTFLNGIIHGVDPETGRLHSHFNQIGADTGRISSRKQRKKITITYFTRKGEARTREKMIKVGANVQNIPSRKEKDPDGIRGAFEAPLARATRIAMAALQTALPIMTEEQRQKYERIRGDITAYGHEAQEDYTLIVADYSGFELCMAIYWLWVIGERASKMLKTMMTQKSPSAVHALTALGMYGPMAPQISPKNQQMYHDVLVAKYGENVRLKHLKMEDWKLVKIFWPDFYGLAKNGNFNLLYGGSPQMMARLRGQDVRDPAVIEENERFVSSWNRLYPEIGEYQNYMVSHGYEHGWVPTISKRRANVKELLSSHDKGTRKHGERKCMNTPCQGSAADIVKVAMNLIENDEELRDYKAVFKVRKAKRVKRVQAPAVALLFPVHDEIVVEALRRYEREATARIVHLMKQPYKDELPFELDVEAMSASNWLLAKGG